MSDDTTFDALGVTDRERERVTEMVQTCERRLRVMQKHIGEGFTRSSGVRGVRGFRPARLNPTNLPLKATAVFAIRRFEPTGLTPFTLDEIEQAFGVSRKRVSRCYRMLTTLGILHRTKSDEQGEEE